MNEPTPIQTRNFAQEFMDKTNALGVPASIFEGVLSFKNEASLCDFMMPFLCDMKVTTEMPYPFFTAIQKRHGLNLEKISKILNFMASLKASDLSYDLKDFVAFHGEVLKMIANYNAIVQPIKTALEKEAQEWQEKQNQMTVTKNAAIDGKKKK